MEGDSNEKMDMSSLKSDSEELRLQPNRSEETKSSEVGSTIQHLGIVIPVEVPEFRTWQHDLTALLRSFLIACNPPSSPRNESLTADGGNRPRCTFLVLVALEKDDIEAEEIISERLEDILKASMKNVRRPVLDVTIRCVPVLTVADIQDLAEAALVAVPDTDFLLFGLKPSYRMEGTDLLQRLETTLESIPDPHPRIRTVGMVDASRPSTPACLLLARSHLEKIEKRFMPTSDQNRPLSHAMAVEFLFDVYYRIGAAELVHHVQVVPNGFKPPAAIRSPRLVPLWWKDAANSAANELRRLEEDPPPLLTWLDVVVPSFRASKHAITRIMELHRPIESLAIRIVVVCDNPASHDALQTFEELQHGYRFDYAAKFRLNKLNLGPGCTRNSGLKEASGDYVLFLDANVHPQPSLLYAYAMMIAKHPEASGFIGRTALPFPHSPRTHGLERSRICFGWDFALAPKGTELGWCITANLCVKRNPDVIFDPEFFPNGGGGEDTDFCLRLVRDKPVKLLPAPSAAARHPYWDDGEPKLEHFVCWARGDRALAEIHREFAFWNLPDAVETSALLGMFGVPLAVLGCLRCSTVAGMILAQPLGEIVYEVISLRHWDLFVEKGLDFATRTAYYTAVISLCHEWGRFRGHVDRGLFFSSFCKQFNWYAYSTGWLRDFPNQERWRLFKRSVVRAICAWVLVKLFHRMIALMNTYVMRSRLLRLALRALKWR